MKHTRLLEIIREEIAGALNEAGLFTLKVPTDSKKGLPQTTDPDDSTEKSPDFLKKYKKVTESEELEEDTLNEVPDFGGKLDQGVAKEFGEKNTLQNAVDKIVGETLTDMGVTLEDLKKDKAKATEALTSIREKVLGAKRKNIPQDPRVTKALEKQEDVEVATLGAISGKSLQQNQTENAIKKALGLVTPGKQGRPAGEPKPEKPASTGKKGRPASEPKSEKTATLTKGDDGFDSVDASDADNDKEATQNIGSDSTAKKLGNLATGKEETFNRILGLVEKYKDDKDKVDAFINKAKNEYKLSKTLLDQLKRVAGRDVKI